MVSCVIWFRAFAYYFKQFSRHAIPLIHLPWYHRNPNIYDVCQIGMDQEIVSLEMTHFIYTRCVLLLFSLCECVFVRCMYFR